MKIRVTLIALAVSAVLSGCATQEPATTTTETTPSATAPTMAAQPAREAPRADTGGDFGKRSVYYEFDRHDVKQEYRALLEQHAAWLRKNPQARITIEGNTDEQGSREYNIALGQRRAEAVTKMLVLLGARQEQIEAVSFGEEKPRAKGHDEASWKENRRSDFRIGK